MAVALGMRGPAVVIHSILAGVFGFSAASMVPVAFAADTPPTLMLIVRLLLMTTAALVGWTSAYSVTGRLESELPSAAIALLHVRQQFLHVVLPLSILMVPLAILTVTGTILPSTALLVGLVLVCSFLGARNSHMAIALGRLQVRLHRKIVVDWQARMQTKYFLQ